MVVVCLSIMSKQLNFIYIFQNKLIVQYHATAIASVETRLDPCLRSRFYKPLQIARAVFPPVSNETHSTGGPVQESVSLHR